MYILTDEDMAAVGDSYESLSLAEEAAQEYANENDSAVTIWKEYSTIEPVQNEEEEEDEEEVLAEEPPTGV